MKQPNPTERPLLSFSPDHAHAGPIVAAVDIGNPTSTLRAARTLAAHFGVEVLALAVVEPLPAYLGGLEPSFVAPEFEGERKAAAMQRLKEQVRDVVGADPAWSVQVVYGDAAPSIARIAREASSPLIVMGIGRHRPIDRFLGTETTLRTIHRASCPVLAVSVNFNALPRHVVMTTDFSAASAFAAEAAVPLLAAAATVSIVHVWQPSRKADPELQPVLAQIDEGHLLSMPKRFNRLIEILALPEEIAVRREIREGDPVGEVLDYAEIHQADLIVAGRHGMSPLARFMVGSVTSALIRGAKCSVLVTPEPRYADVDRLDLRLVGVSEAQVPTEWKVQLDNFSRRNQGRRTALEVDDPTLGVHVQETGYVLRGAAYDPRDRRVELMLGDPSASGAHVTRGIGSVTSVSVAADVSGRDMGLRVTHGEGQTLLTFAE